MTKQNANQALFDTKQMALRKQLATSRKKRPFPAFTVENASLGVNQAENAALGLKPLIAAALCERMGEITTQFSTPLIWGDDDGQLITALRRAKIFAPAIKFIVADIAPPADSQRAVDYITCLPDQFPQDTPAPDLILSPAYMHWCDQLPLAISTAFHHLQKGGFFLSFMIGGYSLARLRQALIMAESEIMGGASARISPMIDIGDGGRLMQAAGFQNPVAERERLTLSFASFTDLLYGVRAGGLGNLLSSAPRGLCPKSLFPVAAKHYAALDGLTADGRFLLEMEFIVLSGWKS